MRTLIVATNTTQLDLPNQIAAGMHNRVDYLELSRREGFTYTDYNPLKPKPLLHFVEDLLRVDFRQAFKVAQIVRREKYDQVFSMSERVGIPLAPLLSRKVRHVVQLAHGLSPVKLAGIRLAGISRRWNVLITPTLAEAHMLRRHLNLGENRVRLLHYPVDTHFFTPELQSVEPSQEDHIESLGLSYRDYPTLIEAMRYLPHILCYIRAGSTWYNYRAQMGKVVLPQNVVLKPYVSPHSLRACYLQSRFMVVPIRKTTQWSAGCTAVSQAQAMGRAVIATRTPGLGDYLKDGETGLLVEPSNPRALADAIQDLWDHPQKATEMGRKGRAWTVERFSIEHWLEEICAILEGD